MIFEKKEFLLCGGNLERATERTYYTLEYNKSSLYSLVEFLLFHKVKFDLYENVGKNNYFILDYQGCFYLDKTSTEIVRILMPKCLEIQEEQRKKYYKKGERKNEM